MRLIFRVENGELASRLIDAGGGRLRGDWFRFSTLLPTPIRIFVPGRATLLK